VNRTLTLQRAAHASPVAIAALVVANAVPLLGVLQFGWDLATLVAVYWVENGVVGIYAVGRILTAGNVGALAFAATTPGAASGAADAAAAGAASDMGAAPPPSPAYATAVPPGPPPPPPDPSPVMLSPAIAKLFMVPFFCVHYGLFWVVHGIFVWTALPALFAMASGGVGSGPDGQVVLFAFFFMLASHGVSFVVNWLLGGEYRTSNPAAEMGAPYVRVVILHLTIIFGAFAVALLGQPIGALVVMVLLKTGVDLAAHLGERARAARRAREAGLSPAG
jgi:hypothetical protein